MERQKLTAADLMTQQVQTVAQSATLLDAIGLMERGGFSQIPVMQGDLPVALLTEQDVRQALMQGNQDRPVLDLASPLPQVLSPDDRVSAALVALEQQESLLVLDAENRLVGIITYWDVLDLSEPFLLVTEIELILRRVVAASYEAAFGPDWWPHVPEDVRRRAEEEHHADENEEPTAEHMLGHTSFWALNQAFRKIKPGVTAKQARDLDRMRVLRNQVAHHYHLSQAHRLELKELTAAVGDWLVGQMPPGKPLEKPDAPPETM